MCGTENDDFAVVCVSCKGYIQAKVDTLDLFRTIWGLIESPGSTFRRIALAGSKNYVLPLTFAFGIALVYAMLWRGNYGVREPQLTTLLGIGVVAGPVLGGILFWVLSRILSAVSRATGRKIAKRNAFALFAYAASPVVLSLVIVFPLEIAVFGVYLFDNNPPPIVLNPAAFVVLAGLDVIASVWFVVLLGIGIRVMGGGSRIMSGVLAGVFAAMIVALFFIPLP